MSGFISANSARDTRVAEVYPTTRSNLPNEYLIWVSSSLEEEYSPPRLRYSTGSTLHPSVFEDNGPSSRNPQASVANMTAAPVPQGLEGVKLHIKTSDWCFDFEGPYSALSKVLESLGMISENMSNTEQRWGEENTMVSTIKVKLCFTMFYWSDSWCNWIFCIWV